MQPQPEFIRANYRGSGRLDGKRALITGGDSGIGRAVAVNFAAEGAAAVGIVYLDEHGDAAETERLVEEYGTRCVRIQGDIAEPDCAARAVREFTAKTSPRIDVLAAYRGSPKLIDYSATKGAITTGAVVRQGHADEAGGAAFRGRALLRVLVLRGRRVHDGSNVASERRRIRRDVRVRLSQEAYGRRRGRRPYGP